MAYTPVQIELGPLPECHQGVIKYSLAKIPSDAKEILVYSFVTTHNEGPFQRGYYTLYTSTTTPIPILPPPQPIKYSQYLNVATGAPAVTVNSANMWFPLGNTGDLVIELTHPGDPQKSIAHKPGGAKHAADLMPPWQSEWSNVYIIGWR